MNARLRFIDPIEQKIIIQSTSLSRNAREESSARGVRPFIIWLTTSDIQRPYLAVRGVQ